MDPKQHAAYIKRYQNELLPRFDVYAETLAAVLQEAVKRYAPLGIVQARPKAVPSFAEKIVRKGYSEPFVQMTDLCGARVITITQDQVAAVSAFIKESFEVDYANSLDVAERLGTSEFGYRSVHYVVQFRPGECLGVKVPKEILPAAGVPFKAEIQVRTVLQHGWSEVLHDRIYKNSIKVPAPLQRDGARLAALLEESDGTIARVVEDIDAYVVDIGAYMTHPEILAELDQLALILQNEKSGKAREALALRMARMHRAIGQWASLVALLKPFASKTRSAALLREYGQALCETHADSPGGAPYGLGQNTLLRALDVDPNCAETHAALARSYQRQVREASRVRDHLRKAYHLAPNNPYLFVAYIEYELLRAPGSSLIPALTPAIRDALATCARHVEVGIELPQAHLTIGKLHLLLGEAYPCLDAYAKGLRMALDPDSGVCPACIERELDALARLANAREGLPGDSWTRESLLKGLRRMLMLGLYLATRKRAHWTALQKLKLADIHPAGRVLMVAGACAKSLEPAMKTYEPMLRNALAGFAGTVIGGGTTAGVSGIVGRLAKAIPNRRFITAGYYPARMASRVNVDSHYDVLTETDAPDFSPLDAIQAWVDVVCAGFPPERVSILGISGGDISGFEYRLGLALGASVGVIAGSGRAADALLADKAWRALAPPLGLVRDPMTLRAFVYPGDDSVPKPRLDGLARAIHTAYCGADPGTLNKRILRDNGLPWDQLPQTFKNANLAQANYIGEILKTEGYSLAIAPANGKPVNSGITFSAAQIERMAEMEHGRWNVERLRDGWTPGKRNDAKKTHDCLVPWACLPNDIRQYDRNAVASWPRLLDAAGIQIQKTKSPS